MPLRRSSARSLHPAPHLQMGLPQVRTSGVLHTDVSQALLHLDIASGHSGHLRMVIFTVWADPHAAFLRPVSAPSNTHLDRGESSYCSFPKPAAIAYNQSGHQCFNLFLVWVHAPASFLCSISATRTEYGRAPISCTIYAPAASSARLAIGPCTCRCLIWSQGGVGCLTTWVFLSCTCLTLPARACRA